MASRISAGKGTNYMTGNGTVLLAQESADTSQICLDMRQMQQLALGWVRIEMPMNGAIGSGPNQFNLPNFVNGIRQIGAKPLLVILGWHYPDSSSAITSYRSWLSNLVTTLGPNVGAYEIGNEPNLDVCTESYPGTGCNGTYPGPNPDQEPYGWSINTEELDGGNTTIGIGACASGIPADYLASVQRYVAWLQDSYTVIKSVNPNATVILGGLSSWKAQCFLQALTQLQAYNDADAIAWHAYPFLFDRSPPNDGANSLTVIQPTVAGWSKSLPIWITEFGFSSYTAGENLSETVKAQYITQEYNLLRQSLTGPILLYTARDWPLTSADSITNGGTGGSGVFEYLNGQLTREPAFLSFGSL